jgi:hypothetical protein
VLPSEPQTIGGVLDSGFSVYRKTFKSVAVPAVIFAVVMAGVSTLMTSSIDFETLAALSAADADESPAFPDVGPLFFVAWALSMATFVVFFLAVAHRQWDLIQGREPSLSRDVMRGLALLIPIVVASVLYYLCVVIGIVLLVIPGLIVMVSMSLYLFVPIVEDRGAWLSTGRSHALVWGGNWWRTGAVFTVLMAVAIALSLAFQLVLGTTGGFDSLIEPTEPTVLATLGGALLAVVLYPLITAVMLALYNDLLIRKDAGDLDSKLAALDQPSS